MSRQLTLLMFAVTLSFIVVVSFASPRVEAYALCGPQSAASAESTSESQMESDSPKSAGPSGAQSTSSCDGGSSPTTPSSLTTPSTSTSGSIFISWGGASSSSNFVYKLSESKNGDPYITAHTVSSTATNPLSVTLNGRGNGTYAYKIEACYIGGSCSNPRYSTNNTVVTLPLSMPDTPNKPSAPVSSSTGSYTVSWGAVTHATEWRLEEYVANTATTNLYTLTGETNRSKPFNKTSEYQYEYRVKACNGPSTCSDFGPKAYVNVAFQITDIPNITSGNAATTFGNYGDITLTWDAVDHATSYTIEETTGTGQTLTTSSLTDTFYGLMSDKSYKFRIKGCNVTNCGNWSALHNVSLSTQSLVSGEPRQRESVTLNVEPNGRLYFQIEVDGVLDPLVRLGNSFTVPLSPGFHVINARRCETDDPNPVCDVFAKPFTVEVVPPPGIPSSITRSGNENYDGELTLSWGDATGEVHTYELYSKLNGGAEVLQYSGSLKTKNLSNVSNGNLQYLVRACNTINNLKECNDYRSTSTQVVKNLKQLIPDWDIEKYGIYEGNFNANPGNETLILGHKEIVLLHGDIITPITIFPTVHNAVVSWNAAGVGSYSEFSFDADPDNYVVHLGNLGSDSFDEIFLQANSKYGTSHILNSSGGLVQTISNNFLKIDWSSATYTASIQSNGINLDNIASSSEDNFANTNSSTGAVVSLQTPITQATINGNPPKYIYKGEPFEYKPIISSNGSIAASATNWSQSWMSIDSNTARLFGTPTISAGNQSYTVTLTVKETKSHSVSTSQTFTLQVLEAFTISHQDYDVYTDSNGNIYLKAKNGSAFFRLVRDGNEQWLMKISESEFNAFNSSLNLGYRVAIKDYDSDGLDDLVIYPYGTSGGETFAVSSISNTSHVTVVGLGMEFLIPDAPLVEPVVEANQPVGAIEANGGVSGGAATYDIPIAIPPGRAGMQPGVSLSYSSRGGNGLAGVGWNLSAGSAITRCAASHAIDGYTAAPQYHATRDRLCLNGQRLIFVSGEDYGKHGAEYRTEIDGFARVKQFFDINNGSAQFTVETKDGQTQRFGASDDSRHKAQGRVEVLTWAVTDVTDPAGNSMKYNYSSLGEGEYTLDSIHYTGKDGNYGSDYREVKFLYENREAGGKTDYQTSYLAGGKSRMTKRLSAIQTFYGMQQIREYKLTYGSMSLSSGRTLLRSVQECAFKNSIEYCLPSTDFEWQENATKYVLEPVTLNDNGTPIYPHNGKNISQLLPSSDIDGDGVRDWPGVDYDNDGNLEQNGFSANAERQLKGTHNYASGGCYSKLDFHGTVRCHSADFNQDGKTDTYKVANNGNIYIRISGEGVWQDTGISLAAEGDRIISFSDFNADGWADITVMHTESGSGLPEVYIYFNNRDAANLFSVANRNFLMEVSIHNPSVPYVYNEDIQEMGDMDGNGMTDFIVYMKPVNGTNKPGSPRPASLILTHSQLDGSLTYTESGFDGYMTDLPDIQGEAYTFLDVNADGLTDWLTINGDGYLAVKLNLGGTFEANWTSLNISLPGRLLDYYADPSTIDVYTMPMLERTMIMDYNGDGRPELMYADNVVASACSLVFHYPVKGGARAEEYMCGDALWKRVIMSESGNFHTPIDGSLKDVSARRYKAIFFTEGLNGSITANAVDTDIIASPVERAAIDAFGNGLTDVVTTFECKIEGCEFNPTAGTYTGSIHDPSIVSGKLYVNRNVGAAVDENGYASTDVLSKVTNGLGAEKHWTYRPLGSDEFDITDAGGNELVSFYEPDHEYAEGDIRHGDQDYFHFSSSMMVVAEHSVSSGLGNQLNATKYRYRGAIYNNKGRGFQGFRSIQVDSPTGTRAVTDFHQKFPLAGQIEFARSCLIDDASDPDCINAPLSESHTGYMPVNTTPTNRTKWVIPVKSVAKTYEMNQTTLPRKTLSVKTSFVGLEDPGSDFSQLFVTQDNYDIYGNILKSTSLVDGGFGVNKSTTQLEFYAPDVSNWWITKLKSSSVTTEAVNGSSWGPYLANSTLDGNKSIVTTINSYDNTVRMPIKITVEPTEGKRTVSISSYNDYGLPDSVTTQSPDEPATPDRTVTTTYSSDFYFVESVTNDAATVTSYVDAIHGQVSSAYDANANVSVFEYDPFGRVEKSKTDGSPFGYQRYADCFNCDGVNNDDVVYKVTTQGAGQPRTVEYRDKLNRALVVKTQVFDGDDAYVHVVYDRFGRKTFESVPGGAAQGLVGTTYDGYDAIGRLLGKTTNQTRGQTYVVEYQYGVDGAEADRYRTKIVVNNYERVLYRTYSGTGQLMQTTDALDTPGITSYAYDGTGNPIALVDANGSTITATYNDLGQKKWVDDPNMGSKSFTYTGFGEVESETDAIGNTTTYFYDTLGRLTSRSVAGPNENASATFEYDNPLQTQDKCIGLPSREYKNDGSQFEKSYYYNNLCQLTMVKTTIDESDIFVMQTQIDSNYGRPKAITYPNGLTIAYDYTSEGYLKKTINAANNYVYREITGVDDQGNWTGANLVNNNASIVRSYNPETGQMASSEWFSASITQQKLEYWYEKYGNLEQQKVVTGLGNTSTENYYYDKMHRLTQTSRDVSGMVTDYYFAYDAVGNIEKKTDFSADSPNAYTYGSVTRSSANGWAGPNAVRTVLLANDTTRTYGYDNNGNLKSDGIRTIDYNAFNKPTRITVGTGVINPKLDSQATANNTADIFYGSDQMRYKQVKQANGDSTTHFYIGKQYEKIIKVKGATTTIEKKTYIDDIAVMTEKSVDGSVETIFFHKDRLGSMTAEIDDMGVVVKAHSFDAFGRPRNENLDDRTPAGLFGYSTNRGFTEHEHLDESQLIHMNGRVYDYNLGRFLSVDPFIQEPGNSQSMNPYSYIMNNPLGGTDPSGYKAEEVTKKIKVVSSKAGSRIQRKSIVTVTATSDGNGGATATVSGSNGAAVAQVAGTVAGKMAGAGLSVSVSVSDIGSQQNIAQSQNKTRVEYGTPPTDAQLSFHNSNDNEVHVTKGRNDDEDGAPTQIEWRHLTEPQRDVAIEAIKFGIAMVKAFRTAFDKGDKKAIEMFEYWTGFSRSDKIWVDGMSLVLKFIEDTMTSWIKNPSLVRWTSSLVYGQAISNFRDRGSDPVFIGPYFWGGGMASMADTMIHEAAHYHGFRHYVTSDRDVSDLATYARSLGGDFRISAYKNNYNLTNMIFGRKF